MVVGRTALTMALKEEMKVLEVVVVVTVIEGAETHHWLPATPRTVIELVCGCGH